MFFLFPVFFFFVFFVRFIIEILRRMEWAQKKKWKKNNTNESNECVLFCWNTFSETKSEFRQNEENEKQNPSNNGRSSENRELARNNKRKRNSPASIAFSFIVRFRPFRFTHASLPHWVRQYTTVAIVFTTIVCRLDFQVIVRTLNVT